MPEIRQFHVPMPPSVNNLFVNVVGRGRVPSSRYTKWRIAAGLTLNDQKVPRLDGPVHLEYSIGTNTRADLANTEKALTDLLVSSAIIDGDDRMTVRQISMWWGDHQDVRVTVRAFQPSDEEI